MKDTCVIRVDDLITIIDIINDYEKFSKNLTNLISVDENRKIAYDLAKVSEGIYRFKYPKLREFYKNNKKEIDIINKNTSIDSFICYNYDKQGNPKNSNGLDYFYKYLINNKENLNKIKILSYKLKEFNFYEIVLDRNNEVINEYTLNNCFARNSKFVYSDKINIIYNDGKEFIKYNMNNSNYKMILYTTFDKDEILSYGRKIILKDLLFDINTLPTEITKKETFDKIINYANNITKDEYQNFEANNNEKIKCLRKVYSKI